MKLWRIIEYPFLYTKAKKICKIRKPSGLSLNPLFKKECHLLSDKLESMERNLVFATNSKLLIIISLHPDGANL